MKTSLDCIPCFARQALEAARFVSDSPKVHEQVIRSVLQEAAEMDLSVSPPVIGQKLHRTLRQLTGIKDPYAQIKKRFNELALEMMPKLTKEVEKAPDPLYHALRLAIAGNVIDLGVNGNLREEEIQGIIEDTLNEPFHGDLEDFRKSTQKARNILYLADNAGEIIFDRLLIEKLPMNRLTLAVRGAPILNDALHEDAEMAGLCDLVEVIDNGSDAPGTIWEDCSRAFRQKFAEADLIIAKGQGNFETLSEETDRIFFLFKAKCPVIADHVGLPLGTHIAIRRQHFQVEYESSEGEIEKVSTGANPDAGEKV
jgi:damage-control phosphatase, subfamily I